MRSKAARAEDALSAVLQLPCAGRACAVNTTEDLSIGFDAVADDTAIAVGDNCEARTHSSDFSSSRDGSGK